MQIVQLSREGKVWLDSNSLARAIYALQETLQVIIAHGRSFPQPLIDRFHITTPELLAIR